MDTKHLLSLKVSLQPKIWLPIEKEISIEAVLNKIQSCQLEAEIDRIRQLLYAGEMESFAMYKRSLPAVTFCGCFDRQRRTENLKNYNYVLVLDIDKLAAGELDRTADILEQDPYVFAYWLSPSGNGFKGLVALEYKFEVKKQSIATTHKKAFQKLAGYFWEHYGLALDESGCDITRLCFLSSDGDLVIKQQAKPFVVDAMDLRSDFKTASTDVVIQKGRQGGGPDPDVQEDKRLLQYKNKAAEKDLMEQVIGYLQDSQLSITGSYEQWYKVAYALAEAFTYKVGLDYYLTLCAMDGPRFDRQASEHMFHYCYKNADGRIKLNSLVFFAGQLGFKQQSRLNDE